MVPPLCSGDGHLRKPLDHTEEGEDSRAFRMSAQPVNQETYLRHNAGSSPRGNGEQSLIGL
jgi:hypothetical protein